ANLENLVLTGSSSIAGVGNALDNTLSDNSGSSTLAGEAGNDGYVVTNSAPTIVENASEGTDSVAASVSYTLSANVENLTLTGSALIGEGNSQDNNLVGNSGANTLTGAGGNDTIDGGAGADSMIGGTGNDSY